jgi:serine/threonine protein kinase
MVALGQRIGEYVMQERIAAGTFGEVWRSHHHVWADQIVAIKIPTDYQYLRNLQREGIAIHGLHHPNVVRAIGFDPYADPPYLTMEYVPGVSLRAIIARGAMRPDDAIAAMRHVLAGLAYAHSKGVVHRDVKPENILVHERAMSEGFHSDGAVKVTDFGLGKSAMSAGAGSIAYSASLNDPAAKEIAGTLDYMSPEQRAGNVADGRADIYACGVVLYEMLTGERPAGTDVPSDVNPSVPKHLDEAFRRSYSRLDKRFATAEQFATALGAPPPPIPRRNAMIERAEVPPPPLPWVLTTPVRPPAVLSPSQRAGCPQCRGLIDASDQFCMHCGVQLVENVRRCPQCGAFPDAADHYCIFCGQSLTSSAPPVSMT